MMSVEKAEKVVLQEHSLNYFCSQRAEMKQESVKESQNFYYRTALVLLMHIKLDFAGLTV